MRTLLILDDEENVRAALTRVFRREGYQVLLAGTPTEAATLLAADCPWVVLSDHQMPEMSGTEFLALVRDRYPDTRRILLSGQVDSTVVASALDSGAVHRYVSKPWNDDDLRACVRSCFDAMAQDDAAL